MPRSRIRSRQASKSVAAIKIQGMAAKRCATHTLLSLHTDRLWRGIQDKQLYLQLGPDDVLRGRHGALPTIRARQTDFAHAEEPGALAATAAGADRRGDARGAARSAGDRVLLGTYPDVVRTHEPSGVVTFAFRLAHAISSAWETVVVKGEADVKRARARMWPYLCARDVLGAAMRLLSIRPLERM